MKKNKIAVFLPADIKERNSSAIARIEMFQYLKNIHIDIYHFGNVGPYYSEASPINIKSYFKTLRKFTINHKKSPYKLIWATLPPIIMAIFATRLKIKFKIPLIVDVRDPGIASVILKYSKNNWRFIMAKKIEKWIYSRADKICVVTPELRTVLRQDFKVPFSKIEVISNATTHKKTAIQPIKDAVRIFFGGNFSSYQVIDEVIKNIAVNKRQSNGFIFYFYGYDKEKQPELLKIVKSNKIDGFVRLLPPVDRNILFNELSKSHIAIVPISGLKNPDFFDYAIPLKFYEALAYSKPILLFQGTKASKNIIAKQKVGLLCKDNENIFVKLNQIKNNYSFYQKNCQKTIFSRKNEANKLSMIINSLTKDII